MLIKGEVAV
uniref:Uncharacterized protein n=1 Tax=Panagrolaimus sp. ES5 TaxID=591445 RepID=A0AC34GJ08_9BILA